MRPDGRSGHKREPSMAQVHVPGKQGRDPGGSCGRCVFMAGPSQPVGRCVFMSDRSQPSRDLKVDGWG